SEGLMSGQVSSYPASRLLGTERQSSIRDVRGRLPRVPEVLLSLLSGALLLASYRQPWWSIRLYAPQYPKGLGVEVLLSGARGDVREIDTLNHYIGMASLTTAAPLERQLSLAGIALAALVATALLLVAWRKANFVALGLLVCVPLGFIVDFSYWLYRFGHNLNPHAPLRLPPFTPDLFGNGIIGQFMTFARPELGFWLAVAAAGLAALVVPLRQRRAERGGGR
ncbi:MAG TPA: hypothetical protein VFK05_31260, partial [Polyangiaceae bacterium]|nr:hypothetical protein [Polyangiaceae bacterium]